MTSPPPWTPAAAASELETLSDCLRFATTALRRAGSELCFRSGLGDAAAEASFLVVESLRLEPEEAEAMAGARLLRSEREAILSALHERLTSRRPMAYILGVTYYCGHRLAIDERALIPRSAIGTMLEDAFLAEDAEHPWRILDLGTGSGGIAIAFAHAFPEASLLATEVSEEALALAQVNVEAQGLGERLRLQQADLFEGVDERFDWILCNPPYVSEDFKEVMTPEYGYEPELALFGGETGLGLILPLLQQAPRHLRAGGRVFVEMGDITGERFREAYPDIGGEWYCHPESGRPVVFCIDREALERWVS